MAKSDLTGHRFGRLVALNVELHSPRLAHWRCRCDCGRETIVRSCELRRGHIKSCGCLHTGRSNEAIYSRWQAMRGRCGNPLHSSYPRYGGRGIKVCDQWQEYSVFKQWALESGFVPSLELDRIDNDGNYEPSNCRWADRKTQTRNRSGVRLVSYRGKTATIAEHSEDAGVKYSIVQQRLTMLGWSIADAIQTPAHAGRRGYRASHD